MTQQEITNEAIELLKNLIETPSFSSEENKTAVHIENWFKQHHISYQRNVNNVWAVNNYFDKNKPTLLLNSHHDTVKPNNGYTNNPFKAIIKDGKLYGLGSNDAGGCLVSLIATFTHFYTKKDLKYNLVIVASAEEESSGKNGLNSMLSIIPKVDVAIIGEPTLMNFTQINAGKQHNAVPAEVNLVIDVRVNDKYTNQEIVDILTKESPCDTLIPRSLRLNSSSIPINHELVQAGIALGRETYGSPTMSDQAVLCCPSLKLGPGDSKRSHTADEFIYINEIEEGIAIYIKLLEKIIC